MILRDRPSGLQLFLIMRGSILSSIWPVMLTNLGVAVLVTMFHGDVLGHKLTLTAIPFNLIGLSLAIFLGFRNNAAYDRYWEGRKLWGTISADCRNLARQCQTFIAPPIGHAPETPGSDMTVRILYRAIAFAHALRQQLRDDADHAVLQPLLADEEWRLVGQQPNLPLYLMGRMGNDLQRCLRDGRIDSMQAARIDTTFDSLTAAATGCERIKTTPIPFSYTLLLHRTAYLYCFFLPFGLVDAIGTMTPAVCAIVAYAFFGLDALGDEIEEPFGLKANDLPLDALTRGIEITLRHALGETDLPPPIAVIDYRLT